jgi:signal transduction histidine kinase
VPCQGEGQEPIELDLVFSGIFVGETPIVMAFGRDITEQQRLDREREAWRAQSAHSQRLEAIGQLAGGIAHDFNNYIHAIQGHLDILKYMHEIKDAQVLRHLDKIDSISEQAGRLTSQLLGFARKGKYHEKIIDIAVLAKRSAELFLPNARAEMGFRIDPGKRKFFVKGDPVQLQQVILNLLLNAKDAMEGRPKDERSLTISIGLPEGFGVELVPPPELKERQLHYCCIRIQDNGTGIDPQAMARIFEPFFTTKPTGKGTGMGLAMAYGTILSHNGWIQVQSKQGIGTAFNLILPIWEDGVSGQLQIDTDTHSLHAFKK